MNEKQVAAVESAAKAIAAVEDVESSDICGLVAELAFKLFYLVNESDLMPTWVRGIGGTHDWVRLGDYNVDFAAVQYGKTYPFVTKVGSKKAEGFYGNWREEVSDLEPSAFFPPIEYVATRALRSAPLIRALRIFTNEMESRGFLVPAL